MRLVRFDAARGREIDRFGSESFRLVQLAAVAHGRVSCVRLGAGGRIGRHPAAGAQLLAVVAGHGSASGADGEFRDLGPGLAAIWEAGEEHETRTTDGLTAIVVEGAGLDVLAPP